MDIAFTPDDNEDEEETDSSDIAESFVDEISRINCHADNDEIDAALTTLGEATGESVSVDAAVLIWQAVSYIFKCRGGKLPDRFRL